MKDLKKKTRKLVIQKKLSSAIHCNDNIACLIFTLQILKVISQKSKPNVSQYEMNFPPLQESRVLESRDSGNDFWVPKISVGSFSFSFNFSLFLYCRF